MPTQESQFTEAPNDSNGYRRKNLGWEADPIQSDAASDSKKYARKDAAWEEVKDYRNLSQMEDVDLTTPPTNTQVLKYDGASSKWKASSDSSGIADVGDANNYLRTQNAWVNAELKNLSDVSDSLAPVSGQALIYNSGIWNAQTLPTPAQTLDDLTDVTISGATPNQVLKYNGSIWINGTDNGISTAPTSANYV